MRADIQNMFIRIYLLYCANQEDLTIQDALTILERKGYRVGEREVKQELAGLAEDQYLTLHDERYSITGAGLDQLTKIQSALADLCSEVVGA